MKLSDLVEYALKHSLSFKNSQNQLKIDELRLSNSFYRFFPSLDIRSAQGYRDGRFGPNDDKWSSELTLSMNSRLYDNGLNILNHRRLKLEGKRGILEWERARGRLCLKLSQEYFNYSLAIKIFNIQSFQYKLLEKQFKSVESGYKQGLKSRIDYVRFKARLQRAQLGMQQADVVRSRRLEELKRIIGWKGGGGFEIAVPEKGDFGMDKILGQAPNFEEHYDYKITELSKKINKYTVVQERKKYLPELFLAADASYAYEDYLSGRGSLDDNGRTNWSASLTIKFNLWDWGERRRNVAIANLEAMNRNNTLEDNLLSLKSSINKLLFDIKQRKESFLLNKELVKLEKNNYTTLERSYRRGMTTFLDLINALNDYTSSRESSFMEFFQLKNLMAEFYFHQGNLYETIKNYH